MAVATAFETRGKNVVLLSTRSVEGCEAH